MALRLGQRPLTASSADVALFVDRDQELGKIRRGLALDFNVLVLGERGSGRTSLMRRLQHELGDRAIYVDAQPWSNARDLTLALRAALGNDVRFPPSRHSIEPDPHSVLSGPPLGYRWVEKPEPPEFDETDAQALVVAAAHEFEGNGRVVLLDGPTPGCVYTLFGRFRDVLWEAPLQWVVAGEARHRHGYLRQPADAFFEAVFEIEPLSPEQAAALLRRRLDAAGNNADALALQGVTDQLVAGLEEHTPRGVLAAARAALMAADSPAEALQRHSDAHAKAAALGRNASMVYAELESLGPVHAGDERLLERLGYTRSRVVQLLKQLEAAGLVACRREGKRVLYSISDASAEASG